MRAGISLATLTLLVWLSALLDEGGSVLEELDWNLGDLLQTFAGHFCNVVVGCACRSQQR